MKDTRSNVAHSNERKPIKPAEGLRDGKKRAIDYGAQRGDVGESSSTPYLRDGRRSTDRHRGRDLPTRNPAWSPQVSSPPEEALRKRAAIKHREMAPVTNIENLNVARGATVNIYSGVAPPPEVTPASPPPKPAASHRLPALPPWVVTIVIKVWERYGPEIPAIVVGDGDSPLEAIRRGFDLLRGFLRLLAWLASVLGPM